MFKVKLLCYNYEEPTPSHDIIPCEFATHEAAETAMLHHILDELNQLNGINEDGNFPEHRFTVQMEDETHDAIVLCWDGEDYAPVTCYNIIETNDTTSPVEDIQGAMERFVNRIRQNSMSSAPTSPAKSSLQENAEPVMNIQRAMELLNSIIDHTAVAENTSTQISNLMEMGFQPDELVTYFHYSQEDVDNVVSNNDDE